MLPVFFVCNTYRILGRIDSYCFRALTVLLHCHVVLSHQAFSDKIDSLFICFNILKTGTGES